MGQEEHATIVDNKHGPLVFMRGSNELMMFQRCFYTAFVYKLIRLIGLIVHTFCVASDPQMCSLRVHSLVAT